MPRLLGRVNPRTHSPKRRDHFYAVLVALLALSGSFAELVGALHSVRRCALRSGQRGGLAAGPSWCGAGRPAVGIQASHRRDGDRTAGMTGMIALGSRTEILGVLGLVAASALVYLLTRKVTSDRSC